MEIPSLSLICIQINWLCAENRKTRCVQVSTMMHRLRDATTIVALSKLPVPHKCSVWSIFSDLLSVNHFFFYVNLSTKSMSSSGCSTWLLFSPSIEWSLLCCKHWSQGFAFRFRTGPRMQVLGHLGQTILTQQIWTIYWPISNIVIKEKPIQSPKIPPQLAMNQIIGT